MAETEQRIQQFQAPTDATEYDQRVDELKTFLFGEGDFAEEPDIGALWEKSEDGFVGALNFLSQSKGPLSKVAFDTRHLLRSRYNDILANKTSSNFENIAELFREVNSALSAFAQKREELSGGVAEGISAEETADFRADLWAGFFDMDELGSPAKIETVLSYFKTFGAQTFEAGSPVVKKFDETEKEIDLLFGQSVTGQQRLILALNTAIFELETMDLSAGTEGEGLDRRFANDFYDADWSNFQKFVFRRQEQLPGFHKFLLERLKKYRTTLEARVKKSKVELAQKIASGELPLLEVRETGLGSPGMEDVGTLRGRGEVQLLTEDLPDNALAYTDSDGLHYLYFDEDVKVVRRSAYSFELSNGLEGKLLGDAIDLFLENGKGYKVAVDGNHLFLMPPETIDLKEARKEFDLAARIASYFKEDGSLFVPLGSILTGPQALGSLSYNKYFMELMASVSSPQKLLEVFGNKVFDELKGELDKAFEKKMGVLFSELTKMIEELGKIDLKAEVKEEDLMDGTSYLEFKKPAYQEWSFFMKFCFRRERQVPGFIAWLKGRLVKYRDEVSKKITL